MVKPTGMGKQRISALYHKYSPVKVRHIIRKIAQHSRKLPAAAIKSSSRIRSAVKADTPALEKVIKKRDQRKAQGGAVKHRGKTYSVSNHRHIEDRHNQKAHPAATANKSQNAAVNAFQRAIFANLSHGPTTIAVPIAKEKAGCPSTSGGRN